MEKVKIEFVPYYYGGINFSFWQVKGNGFTRTNNFKTKEKAIEWAIENGYRVEDK